MGTSLIGVQTTCCETKTPSLGSRAREGIRGATLLRLVQGLNQKPADETRREIHQSQPHFFTQSTKRFQSSLLWQLLYSDNGVPPAKVNGLSSSGSPVQFRGPFNLSVRVRISPGPYSLDRRSEAYSSSSPFFSMQLGLNIA